MCMSGGDENHGKGSGVSERQVLLWTGSQRRLGTQKAKRKAGI